MRFFTVLRCALTTHDHKMEFTMGTMAFRLICRCGHEAHSMDEAVRMDVRFPRVLLFIIAAVLGALLTACAPIEAAAPHASVLATDGSVRVIGSGDYTVIAVTDTVEGVVCYTRHHGTLQCVVSARAILEAGALQP